MATESFHSTMHFNVLVQVRSLSETKATIGDGAHIGSLIGVDSQMVKEIVPFSKPLVTTFMVAFKNFDMSF